MLQHIAHNFLFGMHDLHRTSRISPRTISCCWLQHMANKSSLLSSDVRIYMRHNFDQSGGLTIEDVIEMRKQIQNLARSIFLNRYICVDFLSSSSLSDIVGPNMEHLTHLSTFYTIHMEINAVFSPMDASLSSGN